MNFYYNLKAFIMNLKWMIPAAWRFRPWDSSYNIHLFATSLEQTAKCITSGRCIDGEKYGRRCLYAAKCLKKYYIDDDSSFVHDKSYKQLNKNNPSNFDELLSEDFEGVSVLTREYKISEDYYSKMFKLINTRLNKVDKDRKQELWIYINKYLPYWWD